MSELDLVPPARFLEANPVNGVRDLVDFIVESLLAIRSSDKGWQRGRLRLLAAAIVVLNPIVRQREARLVIADARLFEVAPLLLLVLAEQLRLTGNRVALLLELLCLRLERA